MFNVGDRVKFVGFVGEVTHADRYGPSIVFVKNGPSASSRFFFENEIVPETDPFEDHSVRHFIDTLKKTIEFREADIAALKDKIAEMEDDSSEDEDEQEGIVELDGMLAATTKLNLELFTKGADLVERNAGLMKQVAELTQQRDNSRWEVSNLLAENENLKGYREVSEKKLAYLNLRNAAFAKSINAALKEKYDLQFENASLKGCSEVALKRADALQAENQNLHSMIYVARTDLKDILRELDGGNAK